MRVYPLFALVLLGFPLIELFILIRVGMLIGAFPTVMLVVGTAIIGALLLRHQGLNNYRQMQLSLARGELPAQEMVEGVVILAGAVLLLLPGLITDFIGLICLMPPLRRLMVASWLRRTRMDIRGRARQEAGNVGQVYDADYRHLPSDDEQ